MDNDNGSPQRDDEALADTTSEELLDRLISDEMGEKIAADHAQRAPGAGGLAPLAPP